MLDLPSGDFLLHIVGTVAAAKENGKSAKIFKSLTEQEWNLAAVLLHYSVKQETTRSAPCFSTARAVLDIWWGAAVQYHCSLIFVCIPVPPLFSYTITSLNFSAFDVNFPGFAFSTFKNRQRQISHLERRREWHVVNIVKTYVKKTPNSCK